MNHDSAAYLSLLNCQGITAPELDALSQRSMEEKIPVLRPDSCRLLYLLVRIHRPASILEIGTGSGLSTLWIHRAAPSTPLTTLERDRKRYQTAQDLFHDIPQISLHHQDAFTFMKENDTLFDFIFLDAQKRDYIEYLGLIESHLNPGGLLVADNILMGGKVYQHSLADERKYRSGVEKLKEFNQSVSLSPRWENLFLPLEDGLLVACYRGHP